MLSQFITSEDYLKQINKIKGQNNFYQTKEWLDILSRAFNIEVIYIQTIDDNQSLLALTPFIKTKKGPFNILGSPMSGLYTEFLGPIFKDLLSDHQKEKIIDSQHQLISKSSDYIEWGIESNNLAKTAFQESLKRFKYTYIARPSIVLDLTIGEENIWNNFQGRARNMTRKSEKSGINVKIARPTSDWIRSYYSMLEQTFKSQGREVPHPLSFFLELISFAKDGKAYFFSAEHEGEMVAAAIFLNANKRMLYLSGTSNQIGMKLAANSLIQWRAIQKAIQDNMIYYDLGGLGIPSIDKFKRSFGGEEVTHHRWVHKKRLFKILEPPAIWLYQKGFIHMGNYN